MFTNSEKRLLGGGYFAIINAVSVGMPATMFFIIGNLQTRLILNVTKERPKSVIYFLLEK